MKGKGKRKKNNTIDLEPLEALEYLSQSCKHGGTLKGLVQDASVWVKVEEGVAQCIENMCIGRVLHCQDDVLDTFHSKQNNRESEVPLSGVQVVRFSLEEAFFLHYCMRCLHIYETSGDEYKQANTQGLWSMCMRMQPNFELSYVAYQHFRSKGWIVRSGIFYGCNYVLYSHHPNRCHAAHCVLVQHREEELDWNDVQAIVRVSVGVKKEPIILYVSIDGDLDVKDVNILPLIEVDAVKVTRWTPQVT